MTFNPITPLPSSKSAKRLSFESSGSPLFSPSAAARYAEQAERWNQVDKWLARAYYPNRVPEFERNEETLKWLHDLSIISTQRTKETNALLVAQGRMTEEYNRYADWVDTALKQHGLDLDSMPEETKAAVDEIADIGMSLNVDPMHTTCHDIVKAQSDQIDAEFEAQLQLNGVESANESLDDMLAQLTSLKKLLEADKQKNEAQEDTIDEKIAEWTRTTKFIQMKAEEYKSQLKSPKSIPDDIRISRLAEQEAEVMELQKKAAEAQQKVDRYAKLPPDEKKAKKEVDKLKRDLEHMRRERDALWEAATKE